MNSSELKGYLTGLILGDAYIDGGITKRALRIKSVNRDFIEKLKLDLESCTNFSVNINFCPAHYSCGCNHKDSWELYIKAHPYFAKKYHHFYTDTSRRRASKEALSWLNEAGLANWYMSDGYVCLVGKTKGIIRDRRVDICTDRYKRQTVESMRQMLKDKFDISTALISRNNTYRIRISKNSYETFFNIVYPYLTDSFKYKAYLGYEYQPEWMSDALWKIQENLRSAIALTDNAEG